MAQSVGFEPTVPLRELRFSKPLRYDRFGNSAFKLILIEIEP